MIRRKVLVALLFAVLAVAGGFGVFHGSMDMDELMLGCPLVGMSAVCETNPLVHIGMWQAVFTFLPQTATLLALLLLLVVIVYTLVALWKVPIAVTSNRETPQCRKGYIPISHPLQELFASGILHPKVF